MRIEKMMAELVQHQNASQAVQMEKYMRNQFAFLGIQSKERRALSRAFLNNEKKNKGINWNLVYFMCNQPYREYSYIACDYLLMKKSLLVPDDLQHLKKLITSHSWWDTVDNLDKAVGELTLAYPELNSVMLKWSQSDNLWLKRVAINHQRGRKTEMDTVLLRDIILNNLDSDEFFINKAIGWILRDYSKTNPEWVLTFLEQHKKQLHPLSIKEGSRYLS